MLKIDLEIMLSNSSVGITSNNSCFLDKANFDTDKFRPWDFLNPWAITLIGGLSSYIKIDKTIDINLSVSLP